LSNLSINIDLVASLRELGRIGEPDPTQVAVLAELSGADGIAVQFHRGRKTISEKDLFLLKGVVKSKLIVELSPVEENLEKILEIKPWLVIFSADHADAFSPLSPIDFSTVPPEFSNTIGRFTAEGINCGFFVEPEESQIKAAAKTGAQVVFLNCSGYTFARTQADAQIELDRLDNASGVASKASLSVFAGRGINYKNIRPLIELNSIDEFIIGFSICAKAQLVGIAKAVKEMKSEISSIENSINK